jgi:hypothetical protein
MCLMACFIISGEETWLDAPSFSPLKLRVPDGLLYFFAGSIAASSCIFFKYDNAVHSFSIFGEHCSWSGGPVYVLFGMDNLGWADFP